MRALAIDPGSEQSAYCMIGGRTRVFAETTGIEQIDYKPSAFELIKNDDLLLRLDWLWEFRPDVIAIEWLQNYGMGAGASLFNTARWVGRFEGELLRLTEDAVPVELITRPQVKIHHCHSSRANDSNVKQAVKDRFAPGVRNHGRGTIDQPGFFHGFSKDVWEAFELAVYLIDTKTGVLV